MRRVNLYDESAEGKALLDLMAHTPLLGRSSEQVTIAELERLRSLIEAVRETIQDTEDRHIATEYQRQLESLQKEYKDQFDHFFYANIRLVLGIVGQMSRMEYMDMFQHGCLGLMRAIEKFDSSHNVAFSTYATRWIRQSIQRGCDKEDSLIAIPVHARAIWKTVQKTTNDTMEHDANPVSLPEICRQLNIKYTMVATLQTAMDHPVSLDSSVYEGVSSPQERVPDHVLDPIEYIIDRDRRNAVVTTIRNGLAQLAAYTLPDGSHPYALHAQIMRLRYRIGEPFSEKTKRNLDEVGRMVVSPDYPHGITGDHARQLQKDGARWMIENIPALSQLREDD